MSLRFSTATSDFLFGGYGYGPFFGMGGMVNNPRSGYSEIIGGVGARFSTGSALSHAVAFAASHATESWYAQLYYLPSLTLGRFTADATIQLYVPSGPDGVAQLGMNPLTVVVELNDRLALGGSYQFAGQEKGGPSHGAGPSLRIVVPKGSLSLELMRGIHSFRNEFRSSFRAFF